MLQAHADLRTDRASRYLQAMFKHFAHKVDVEYDAHQGRAAMPFGGLRMRATDEILSAEIDAETPELLARMKAVIDVHLARFAFKEAITGLDWREGPLP
jgi:hypothetical protein